MRLSRTGLAASILGVVAGLAGVTIGITHGLSSGATSASSTPLGDTTGIDACTAIKNQAADYGTVSGLIRGESDTGQQVATWQEQRNLPDISGIVSPLRDANLLSSQVEVCVFGGQFVTPTGPGTGDGTAPPPHDTLTLILEPDGTVVLDSSGYQDGGGADTPAQWRARTGTN